jgi:hypothetical protein
MKKQSDFVWHSGLDFRKLDGFVKYQDHVIGCASDLRFAADIHRHFDDARKRDGFNGLLHKARKIYSISPISFRRWNRERVAVKNFVQTLSATDNLSYELLGIAISHNLGVCIGLEKPYDETRNWTKFIRNTLKEFSQDEISDWAFRRKFVAPSSYSGINTDENDRKMVKEFLRLTLNVISVHMRLKINSHKQFRDIEYQWRYGLGRNTRVALAMATLPNEGFKSGL